MSPSLTSQYTGGGRKRNSCTKAMRGRSRMPLRSSAGWGLAVLFLCSASSSLTTELYSGGAAQGEKSRISQDTEQVQTLSPESQPSSYTHTKNI